MSDYPKFKHSKPRIIKRGLPTLLYDSGIFSEQAMIRPINKNPKRPRQIHKYHWTSSFPSFPQQKRTEWTVPAATFLSQLDHLPICSCKETWLSVNLRSKQIQNTHTYIYRDIWMHHSTNWITMVVKLLPFYMDNIGFSTLLQCPAPAQQLLWQLCWRPFWSLKNGDLVGSDMTTLW